MALICPAIFCFDLSISGFAFEVNNYKEEEKKKERKTSRYAILFYWAKGNVNVVLWGKLNHHIDRKWKDMPSFKGRFTRIFENLFDFLKKSSQKPSDQNSWNLFWSILKNVDSSLIKSWSLWSRMGHNDRGGVQIFK